MHGRGGGGVGRREEEEEGQRKGGRALPSYARERDEGRARESSPRSAEMIFGGEWGGGAIGAT